MGRSQRLSVAQGCCIHHSFGIRRGRASWLVHVKISTMSSRQQRRNGRSDYNQQTNISESFRSEGSSARDGSYRSGSYYDEYATSLNQSSRSYNSREYQDVGTSSRGYTTDCVDSTIGSSQQDYSYNNYNTTT
eukprot:scaffold27508_cov23-Cyclotella_meneghiniana.AAC.1